jgi:hypothetical protein
MRRFFMGFWDAIGETIKTYASSQTSSASIADTVRLVEAFYRKHGLDPNQHRVPDQTAAVWGITKGSALMWIWVGQQDGIDLLKVFAPVSKLPQDNLLPFYRRCLDLNVVLVNCSLGVSDDTVLVVSQRPVGGLSDQELEFILDIVSSVADDLDDKFAAEFGARMASSESS